MVASRCVLHKAHYKVRQGPAEKGVVQDCCIPLTISAVIMLHVFWLVLEAGQHKLSSIS